MSIADDGRFVMNIGDSLWIGDINKAGMTLLAAPDGKRHHRRYSFPDILPDGKAALIAIWRGRTTLDSCYLGIVSLPDGKVTELDIRGAYPRYSTSGHILYLSSNSTGGLYALPFDARSRRVTGAPSLVEERMLAGPAGPAPLAVARNGTIAYLAWEKLPTIFFSIQSSWIAAHQRSLGLEWFE